MNFRPSLAVAFLPGNRRRFEAIRLSVVWTTTRLYGGPVAVQDALSREPEVAPVEIDVGSPLHDIVSRGISAGIGVNKSVMEIGVMLVVEERRRNGGKR